MLNTQMGFVKPSFSGFPPEVTVKTSSPLQITNPHGKALEVATSKGKPLEVKTVNSGPVEVTSGRTPFQVSLSNDTIQKLSKAIVKSMSTT